MQAFISGALVGKAGARQQPERHELYRVQYTSSQTEASVEVKFPKFLFIVASAFLCCPISYVPMALKR